MPLPSIPSELIKKTAGDARFQRGLQLARNLQINQLELGDREASGVVERHQVRVQFQGEKLSGACDCEDSDGFDFCHHCVVLALHANRHSQQRQSLAKGPDRSKVLAYLLSLDKNVLAKQLLDVLDDDPALFRRYILKAALDRTSIDYADLRRQVTVLTRTQERLFSQRQVKLFFARIEEFLEELDRVSPDEPEKMLKVLDYLIQRLSLILDQVDDRNGHRLPCAALLGRIHQRMFLELNGRSRTQMQRFLQSWQLDRHDLLQCPAREYLDETGFKQFVEHMYQTWKETSDAEQERIARTLQGLDQIDLGKEQGLAMKSKLAKEAQDWLDISDQLIAQGETTRAIAVLEQTLEAYPGHDLVINALARLYLSQGGTYQDSLASLCQQAPEILVPLVFPDLQQHDSPQALSDLQTQCLACLLKEENAEAREYCIKIYLYWGEAELAYKLLQAQTKPRVEDLLRCAQLLQDSDFQQSLALVHRTFGLLLDKERYGTDRHLAALIQDFPIRCTAPQKDALIHDYLSQIQRRPAIMEALRQAGQTPLFHESPR